MRDGRRQSLVAGEVQRRDHRQPPLRPGVRRRLALICCHMSRWRLSVTVPSLLVRVALQIGALPAVTSA